MRPYDPDTWDPWASFEGQLGAPQQPRAFVQAPWLSQGQAPPTPIPDLAAGREILGPFGDGPGDQGALPGLGTDFQAPSTSLPPLQGLPREATPSLTYDQLIGLAAMQQMVEQAQQQAQPQVPSPRTFVPQRRF